MRKKLNPFSWLQGSWREDAERLGSRVRTSISNRRWRDSTPDTPTFSQDPINGSIPNHSGGNDNGDVWTSFLQSLSESGNLDNNSLQTLLNSLAIYNNGGSQNTTERNDMIYQFLLQWLSNSEQRGYDYNMLQEQRVYNNPLNQLSRLMGAGISRDAAIQMMSGLAGGSGIGTSGIGASAPSVSAPSGTMDLQNRQFVVDAVYGGIAAVNSLVQSGLSFAQGIEQVRAMNMQNNFTQQQLNAFNSVQDVSGSLFALQQQGVINLSDFNNVEDVIKFINENNANNQELARLAASPAFQTATSSVYGREFMNRYWDSRMKSRSDGDLYNEYVRSARLNNALTEINTSKAGAELSLIDAQTKVEYQSLQESAMRIANMEADIKVKNAQGDWVQIQTDNYQRLADAQYQQIVASTEGVDVQNKINRQLFELNSAGFPMLKQAYIDELKDRVAYWSTITDPDVQKNRMASWMLDGENAYKAAYVMNCYYGAVGSFAHYCPNLYNIGVVFKTLGVDKLLDFGMNVGAAVGAARFITPLVP